MFRKFRKGAQLCGNSFVARKPRVVLARARVASGASRVLRSQQTAFISCIESYHRHLQAFWSYGMHGCEVVNYTTAKGRLGEEAAFKASLFSAVAASNAYHQRFALICQGFHAASLLDYVLCHLACKQTAYAVADLLNS